MLVRIHRFPVVSVWTWNKNIEEDACYFNILCATRWFITIKTHFQSLQWHNKLSLYTTVALLRCSWIATHSYSPQPRNNITSSSKLFIKHNNIVGRNIFFNEEPFMTEQNLSHGQVKNPVLNI